MNNHYRKSAGDTSSDRKAQFIRRLIYGIAFVCGVAFTVFMMQQLR